MHGGAVDGDGGVLLAVKAQAEVDVVRQLDLQVVGGGAACRTGRAVREAEAQDVGLGLERLLHHDAARPSRTSRAGQQPALAADDPQRGINHSDSAFKLTGTVDLSSRARSSKAQLERWISTGLPRPSI